MDEDELEQLDKESAEAKDTLPKRLKQITNPWHIRNISDYLFKLHGEGKHDEALQYLYGLTYREPEHKINLANEVKMYIDTTAGGWFTNRDIYNQFNLKEQKDKHNVVVILGRLKEEDYIEAHKSQSGKYRKVERVLEEIEWKDADPEKLDVDWPLELNALFGTYKRNIMVVSGADDSGKSAFVFDTIKRNQDKSRWKNRIQLFNAEMSPEEMHLRLSKHEDIAINEWRFKAYERSKNFGQCIFPNDFNIIDYIDLPGDQHNMLGDFIREIHERLNSGICLAMLHKKHGFKLGYGQEQGLKIPRLYMTMENGVAQIIKCKNRTTEESSRDKIMKYKLVQGWKFITYGVWHREEDDPFSKSRKYPNYTK